MIFFDKAPADAPRLTGDGYLVTEAKIARTGVQTYRGAEVGRPDLATVRVYRPEGEVFHHDAMGSFSSLPVTIDHPPEAVKAGNWRKYAVGFTAESVARDGGFIRVPLAVKDQAAIDAIRAGTRELSCGYSCDLKWESGKTPSGEAYDAIQTSIRGNHLAIVAAGRAGSECRISFGDHKQGQTSMIEDAKAAALEARDRADRERSVAHIGDAAGRERALRSLERGRATDIGDAKAAAERASAERDERVRNAWKGGH